VHLQVFDVSGVITIMEAFLKGVPAKPKDVQPSGSGTAVSAKEMPKRKALQPWVEK